jgi:glutathione S-transferase
VQLVASHRSLLATASLIPTPTPWLAGGEISAADRQLLPLVPRARRRDEQALVAVVQEAYVNGVSTCKVDRLVAQLGLQIAVQ